MTIAQISKGLQSENFHIRFGTFCEARDLGPETIEPAAEVIFDPSTTDLSRYWATQVVVEFVRQAPQRSREILLGSLADSSPLVRAAALDGLAAFHDEFTAMSIRTHLEDQSEIPHAWDAPYTVSEAAQNALARLAAAKTSWHNE